jgi:hypothetical protein
VPAFLEENVQTARKLLDVLIDIWRPEFAAIYSDNLLDVLDPDIENKRVYSAIRLDNFR